MSLSEIDVTRKIKRTNVRKWVYVKWRNVHSLLYNWKGKLYFQAFSYVTISVRYIKANSLLKRFCYGALIQNEWRSVAADFANCSAWSLLFFIRINDREKVVKKGSVSSCFLFTFSLSKILKLLLFTTCYVVNNSG